MEKRGDIGMSCMVHLQGDESMNVTLREVKCSQDGAVGGFVSVEIGSGLQTISLFMTKQKVIQLAGYLNSWALAFHVEEQPALVIQPCGPDDPDELIDIIGE